MRKILFSLAIALLVALGLFLFKREYNDFAGRFYLFNNRQEQVSVLAKINELQLNGYLAKKWSPQASEKIESVFVSHLFGFNGLSYAGKPRFEYDEKFLAKFLTRVRKFNYQTLFFGGDLIWKKNEQSKNFIRELANLKNSHFVMGNHEEKANFEKKFQQKVFGSGLEVVRTDNFRHIKLPTFQNGRDVGIDHNDLKKLKRLAELASMPSAIYTHHALWEGATEANLDVSAKSRMFWEENVEVLFGDLNVKFVFAGDGGINGNRKVLKRNGRSYIISGWPSGNVNTSPEWIYLVQDKNGYFLVDNKLIEDEEYVKIIR